MAFFQFFIVIFECATFDQMSTLFRGVYEVRGQLPAFTEGDTYRITFRVEILAHKFKKGNNFLPLCGENVLLSAILPSPVQPRKRGMGVRGGHVLAAGGGVQVGFWGGGGTFPPKIF